MTSDNNDQPATPEPAPIKATKPATKPRPTTKASPKKAASQAQPKVVTDSKPASKAQKTNVDAPAATVKPVKTPVKPAANTKARTPAKPKTPAQPTAEVKLPVVEEPNHIAPTVISNTPAIEATAATASIASTSDAVIHQTTQVKTPAQAVILKQTRPPKALHPAVHTLKTQLPHYVKLMRLDKPIGTLLLLWPTLWALWLAAKGFPSLKNLIIFSLGVLVMRSAGCVINDFADRKIDGKVARTQGRPLATGAVTSREALILFVSLCVIAFGLVLCTDLLTIKLSIGGLALAFSYPFMKRHTHLPQVVLGAAFAWGIPMAYAAQTGHLDKNMWLIYLAVVLWTVVYDTFYAMVDRDDDLKIGVKSTAILFGDQDRIITGALQLMTLYSLFLVGKAYGLGWIYYLSLTVVAGLFSYQQVLIRYRERTACFKAFLNNNWVGAAVFVGIAGDLMLK